MMRQARIAYRAVVILGILLGMAAPGTRGEAVADSLEAAARREGKVVVYTSLETLGAVKKVFTEKYGVGLEYWRGAGNRVLDRALTEFRSGKSSFDAVAASQGAMQVMKKQGMFIPYLSPQNANFPRDLKDADNILSPVYRVAITGILYNTKLVKPEDVPKSLEAFLDPKWRGNWVIPDPSQHFATTEWLRNLEKLYGRDWLELVRKLAGTKPMLVESFIPAAQKILSGEALAGISYLHHVYIYGKGGAPLDYVRLPKMLAEGQHVAISAAAPHPNAAKLFENFLISREGLEILAGHGEFVTAKGIYPPIKDAEKISVVLMDELPATEFHKWAAEFRTLFVVR